MLSILPRSLGNQTKQNLLIHLLKLLTRFELFQGLIKPVLEELGHVVFFHSTDEVPNELILIVSIVVLINLLLHYDLIV